MNFSSTVPNSWKKNRKREKAVDRKLIWQPRTTQLGKGNLKNSWGKKSIVVVLSTEQQTFFPFPFEANKE